MASLVAWCVLAQIYTWTDKSGEVHYTDDPATIPKGVKAKTTEGEDITTVEAAPRSAPPRTTRQSSSASSGASRESKRDADEQYWRSSFRNARERIASLQAQVDADQQVVGDNPLQVWGVSRGYRGRVRNQNAEIEARLTRNKQSLVQAKASLDELERRASNAGIPREWRQ